MTSVSIVRVLALVAAIGIGRIALAEPEMAQPAKPATASPAPLQVPPQPTSAAPASFSQIARRVSPAVVTITTAQWLGSGFVIDREGLVVTNAHVVEGQDDIKVHFPDGSHFPAVVVGADAATDVALVKIRSSRTSFPAVALGNDRQMQVGDWVLAIGSPDGLTGTVTAGIVSAIHRDRFSGARVFTDYLQIDAAINHGNSGGPTFDMQGRVVGMNALGSYIATNCSGKLCERNDGIGFSIPVSTIRMVVEDLKSGPVRRGIVGILVEPLTEDAAKAVGLPTTRGALVSDVVAGSPADEAGIKPGDVILKVNGHAVTDDRDCLRQTAQLDEGKSATFTLWRDSKQLMVTAKIINRKSVIDLGPGDDGTGAAERTVKALGLELQGIQSAMTLPGLAITSVLDGSDASVRGLRVGDRVLRVGGRDVATLSDVNLAIEQARAQKREYVLLYVGTAFGGRAYVAVKLAK
ncbi:MAG: trypsin-like peptidase domain-containing protein [Micropepsaceae bacterium]